MFAAVFVVSWRLLRDAHVQVAALPSESRSRRDRKREREFSILLCRSSFHVALLCAWQIGTTELRARLRQLKNLHLHLLRARTLLRTRTRPIAARCRRCGTKSRRSLSHSRSRSQLAITRRRRQGQGQRLISAASSSSNKRWKRSLRAISRQFTRSGETVWQLRLLGARRGNRSSAVAVAATQHSQVQLVAAAATAAAITAEPTRCVARGAARKRPP